MKIMIDIGHPAHVHYFRNAIKELTLRGHEFLVVARDKEMAHELLEHYDIPYWNRGRGGSGLVAKTCYLIQANFSLAKLAKKFKPDRMVSFGSAYLAHVSKIVGCPHLAFVDTEHARLAGMVVFPFTDLILSPQCYGRDHGKKHKRFRGFIELAYLHPRRFVPDPAIRGLLGVADADYAIVRFVSWGATHDAGHRGFSRENKSRLVRELSRYMRVFISSEDELPEDLQPYKIQIPSDRIHDALAFASLFVGESGTMSTESALLGTPAINVSTSALGIGTFRAISEYGLMHVIPDNEQAIAKALEVATDAQGQEKSQAQLARLIDDHIDVTDFMVKLIETYPDISHLDRVPRSSVPQDVVQTS